MFGTYENLIEQCFNTGLMWVQMDRKKKKMIEGDYIKKIEKLTDDLRRKDHLY